MCKPIENYNWAFWFSLSIKDPSASVKPVTNIGSNLLMLLDGSLADEPSSLRECDLARGDLERIWPWYSTFVEPLEYTLTPCSWLSVFFF